MTKRAFLLELESSLEIAPGTLKGDSALLDLECWDSMAALLYMSLADQHCGIVISGERIQKCLFVQDLLALLDDKLAE